MDAAQKESSSGPLAAVKDLEGNLLNRSLPSPNPSFREALRFWFKLGWITFGGTAAHIAVMQEELVDRRQWITHRSFLHALSHCMVLPGPEAQQLATYIGWKLHGKRGGIVAGTLFVLPSMFIILGLSIIYVRFGALPWIAAMFTGMKPAVIALVVVALFKVAKRSLRSPVQIVVAAAAFAAMFFLGASILLVLFSTIALGIVVAWLLPGLLKIPSVESGVEEHEVCIDADPEPVKALLKSTLTLAGIVLLLWFLPLAAFFLFVHDFHFWKAIALFFTRTACVTLGGSYTVLPYVAQVTVSKLHWLSKAQMVDGFALAETTPGPLIIVVAFVGFMAGYNHFHGSLWMGTLALLATTFYTFLPCFLFVFAGAPFVERTQGKPMIEGILRLITAVVVGAILDLTLFLGKTAFFPSGVATLRAVDVASLLWAILALVLLLKFKVNVIQLVLMSITFGLVRYLLAT
jgi:chromate transporter